jgi:hypothetical protein
MNISTLEKPLSTLICSGRRKYPGTGDNVKKAGKPGATGAALQQRGDFVQEFLGERIRRDLGFGDFREVFGHGPPLDRGENDLFELAGELHDLLYSLTSMAR